MQEQLVKLMQEYNASDLDELMDILPDLDILPDEDELPQQEEEDLDKVVLAKEPATPENTSCPFASFSFN